MTSLSFQVLSFTDPLQSLSFLDARCFALLQGKTNCQWKMCVLFTGYKDKVSFKYSHTEYKLNLCEIIAVMKMTSLSVV